MNLTRCYPLVRSVQGSAAPIIIKMLEVLIGHFCLCCVRRTSFVNVTAPLRRPFRSPLSSRYPSRGSRSGSRWTQTQSGMPPAFFPATGFSLTGPARVSASSHIRSTRAISVRIDCPESVVSVKDLVRGKDKPLAGSPRFLEEALHCHVCSVMLL